MAAVSPSDILLVCNQHRRPGGPLVWKMMGRGEKIFKQPAGMEEGGVVV